MSAPDEGLCPHRVPAGGWCAACDLYDEPATRVSAPDEATGSRGEFVSCLPSLGEACGHCHRCTPPAPDPVSADERVVAVLAEHRRVWDHYSPHCSCGKWRDKRDDGTMHAAHVAAALAPVLAEVRAEALAQYAPAVWEAGRVAGVVDAARAHGPSDKRERLLWIVMTPPTDENPYEGVSFDFEAHDDADRIGGTA